MEPAGYSYTLVAAGNMFSMCIMRIFILKWIWWLIIKKKDKNQNKKKLIKMF